MVLLVNHKTFYDIPRDVLMTKTVIDTCDIWNL